jgi:hypothetical protein
MDSLHILWTSDNKDTVVNMLAMYAINSKRNEWWQNVNVRYMGEPLTDYIKSGDKILTI